MDRIEQAENAILPYPLQSALTRELRLAAAEQGNPEFLSMLAGQGLRLSRRQSAGELVALLVQETDAAIRRLGADAL